MRRSSIDSRDKLQGKRRQLSRIDNAAKPPTAEAKQTRLMPADQQVAGQQQQQTQQTQQQPTNQQQQQQQAGPSQASKASQRFNLVINKPQAIVIDLLGVLVCRSFMSSSKEFREFFQHNVLEYLNDNWRQKQLKIMINFFRCSQQNVPDEFKLADREESRDEQIKQAKKHVIWKLRNDPTNPALSLFMLGITEWGYKNKYLQTAIYDDVVTMLKYWKDQLKIPIYVGVGSADFLVMVLSNTSGGNLLPYFNGHMNIMDFDGQRANKDFRKLASLLHLAPEKVLYLTRFRADCRRAMETGMQSLIVLRQDFDAHNLIRELRAKRANATMLDGTKLKLNPADDAASSPSSGRQMGPDMKNAEMKNQMEKNVGSLSMIEDHEENTNPQSSTIVETDLTRYNIVLSLSEIAFRA